MKWFNKSELIRCYRDSRQQRCPECRLTQPVRRAPGNVDANIEALVENVLDPAREQLGRPIIVSSGFRCPLHNTTVGGVKQSQHIQGEAADVHCADNAALARIIVEQGRFDQLILYPTFLHVSYKRVGTNRHRVLRKTTTGYQPLNPLNL